MPRASELAAEEILARAMRVHTDEWVDDIIGYHKPNEEQQVSFSLLRIAANAFLKEICRTCPDCCDRDKAIESARQALFFANASIALKGAI